MAVAAVGLVVNVAAFMLLRAGSKDSLNVRGAYLEVMADMIGSFGVLLAGLVMITTGWPYADPIVGVAIGLFVLPRAYRLGRSALGILMEYAPEGMDVGEVRGALGALPAVVEVHDLHVWTLTSGTDVATVHLRVDDAGSAPAVLDGACSLLRERFGITHVTVQIEEPAFSVEHEPAI